MFIPACRDSSPLLMTSAASVWLGEGRREGSGRAEGKLTAAFHKREKSRIESMPDLRAHK